ncbi:MAG: hypothetical protein ACI4JB_10840 [Porcipelethomonas sp.]
MKKTGLLIAIISITMCLFMAGCGSSSGSGSYNYDDDNDYGGYNKEYWDAAKDAWDAYS